MVKHPWHDSRPEGQDDGRSLGRDLNQRDTIAVRHMVSGLLKLLYPNEAYTKDAVRRCLEYALEARRRVKESTMDITAAMVKELRQEIQTTQSKQRKKKAAKRLRVADGAGAHAVIAPKDRSVGLTTAAIKAASGPAESVPYIVVTNLARTMRDLKDRNIWLIGADDSASTGMG